MIRTNIGMIPGGVQYEDPRTPAAKWMDDHTFIDDRTREVIEFRRANPTIYPEPEWTQFYFVKKQIALFNCQRLNFSKDFCADGSPPAPTIVPQPAARTCDVDGVVLVPVYCKTCSGQRTTSYTCPKCGKAFPL